MPQSPVSLRVPRRCVQISCRRTGTSFGDPGWTLNIAIKVILICFICLNMWVNIMVLALKPGTNIAAKTGNPAGLLFRRIWYSVGKSGVLGITEYRQGRPLTNAVSHAQSQIIFHYAMAFSPGKTVTSPLKSLLISAMGDLNSELVN